MFINKYRRGYMETDSQQIMPSAADIATQAAALSAQARLAYHQARVLKKQENAAAKIAAREAKRQANVVILAEQNRIASALHAQITAVKEQINQILQSADLTVAEQSI